MDKNSATKLIKAKALGCLEQIEEIELSEFMETAEEFPGGQGGFAACADFEECTRA